MILEERVEENELHMQLSGVRDFWVQLEQRSYPEMFLYVKSIRKASEAGPEKPEVESGKRLENGGDLIDPIERVTFSHCFCRSVTV